MKKSLKPHLDESSFDVGNSAAGQGAFKNLGSNWGQRNTRFAAERRAQWVSAVASKGGVVTLDLISILEFVGGEGTPANAGAARCLDDAADRNVRAPELVRRLRASQEIVVPSNSAVF